MSAAAREWRQLQLLSRDSVRHLLTAATLTRDTDPMLFALWMVVVVATPPTLYAVRCMILYSFIAVGPHPEALVPMANAGRMFFVLYTMLATALLATLLWDALFPDRMDQEVLAPLPVRPRTATAARLAAALGVAAAFAAAIAVPTGALFALASASSPALLAVLPMVFVAHVMTLVGGALFTFTALLCLRALAAVTLSAAATNRLALVLQLATVIGLVETFLYLPSVLPFLLRQMDTHADWAMLLPPVWFASAYATLIGDGELASGGTAVWAVIGLAGAAALAVPLYLVPARLMARRALESHATQRAGRLAVVTRALSRMLRLSPPVGSLFEFTIASFSRSARHLGLAAVYLGLAAAVGTVALFTASLRGLLSPTPQVASLSLPLVVIFFMTIGLRSVFSIPTDLPANWTFRLSAPSVRRVAAAARLSILTLAGLPVVLVTMLVAASAGWQWRDVLVIGVFDLLAAMLLGEVAFYGWAKLPFASPHSANSETVKSKWLWFIVALNVFAFRGASLQLAAMATPAGSAIYVAAMIAAIAALRAASRRESQQLTIELDEVDDTSTQTLSLSEAST